MVDRRPRANVYSRCAIGLSRDELRWKNSGPYGKCRRQSLSLALDELAFVKQHTGGQMTMRQRTSGYSMEDHRYDGDADPSANPIPTDGLLFKLAVCIGSLSDRLFGGAVPESDPVESPDPDYALDWYCGI